LRGAHRATLQSGGWTQKALVIAQAAVSLVLLCAAGFLVQSLRNMQHQNFGFQTANRYVSHIDPHMAGYTPEKLAPLYRQLHDNMGAIPGVSEVGFAMYSPMEGDNWSEQVYVAGHAPPPPGSNENQASWVRVSAGYFDTIGTKVIKGRAVTDQDTATSRSVAVVNETFVRKFFKDEDPIGKHFGIMDAKYAGSFEIVGVTEDTQYREPTSKIPPTFFLAADQWTVYEDQRYKAFEDSNHYLNAIVLKTQGNVSGLEPQVRRAIAQVNPDLAVIDFMTFAAQVDGNFTQQAMLAKEQAFIDKFKARASHAAQVQSRVKKLEKIEKVEPPKRRKVLEFEFRKAPRSGDDVARLDAVGKSFGARKIYEGLDLLVRRRERWCVMGVNGAGKSTLLKLVAGEAPPDSGTVTIGASVKMGYFAQHSMELLDAKKTVIETLREAFPLASIGSMRSLAGGFGFSGDDVDKPCRILSGGEKSRLVLARMLFDPPNFLILDEPTNHLDLETKEMLVDSLREFEGTMLFVSHDRTFLRGLSNRVLELRPGDGNGVPARPPFEYGGSYVEFVERTGSEAAGVHG